MEIGLTKNEGYSLNKKYENNYSLNNLIRVEIEKYQLQNHLMRMKEKTTSNVILFCLSVCF